MAPVINIRVRIRKWHDDLEQFLWVFYLAKRNEPIPKHLQRRAYIGQLTAYQCKINDFQNAVNTSKC